MSKKEVRQARIAARRRTEQRRKALWWVLGIVVVGGLVGLLVWNNTRPAVGQAIPTLEGTHIPDGTNPGEYNSNPPTSGPHYSQPMPPGFYEEADLDLFGPYPVGYAVHSLEHGHIIFWYNCDLLTANECDTLKTDIRDYMSSSIVSKLIAYPWHDTDVPLVLTSWGYLLEMPEFDSKQATSFINSNRLKAPEPNAP